MAKLEIIDREEFVKTIIEFLKTDEARTKFYFLSGKKGIGKTSVLKKASKQILTDRINIEIDFGVLGDVLSEFSIIYKIALELNEYAKNYNFLSIDSYFKRNSIPRLIASTKLMYNTTNVASLHPVEIVANVSKYFKNIYDKYTAEDNEKLLLNYIREILINSNRQFIFWFFNNRDINSLLKNSIYPILQQAGHHYVIETQSPLQELISFKDKLTPELIDCEIKECSVISEDDAKKIFKILDIPLNEYTSTLSLIKNMWDVVKASPKHILSINKELDTDIIEGMSNTEKGIMVLISLGNYQIKKNEFSKILKAFSYTKTNVKNAQKNLIKKKIIYMNGKFLKSPYRINLDSIEKKFLFTLCEAYSLFLNQKKKNDEVLKILIRIYSLYSPKNLRNIIKQNAQVITKYYSSADRLEKIEIFLTDKRHFSAEEIESQILFLIKLYYKLGKFENAYKLLLKLEKETKTLIIFKAMLLNRIHCFDESIAFINQHYQDYNDNHYKFILKNILLINYGRLRTYGNCKDIFYELLEDKTNEIYDEFPILLKNTEIFLEKEAYSFLKRSLSILRKTKKRKNDYGETLVSYGMLLSWDEKHFRAVRNLKKGNHKLDKTFVHCLSMENNLIAVKLNKGKSRKKYSDKLMSLLVYAESDFQRISIAGNVLIAETLSQVINNAPIAEKIIMDIIDKEMQKDELISLIVLYQVLYFHNHVNSCYKNLSIIKSCEEKIQSIYEKTNNEKILLSEIKQVKNRHNYIVNYLTFWNFEINELD